MQKRCSVGLATGTFNFAIATRPLSVAATAGWEGGREGGREGRGGECGGNLIIPTRSDIRFLVSGNRQQRSFAEEPANFQFYGRRKTPRVDSANWLSEKRRFPFFFFFFLFPDKRLLMKSASSGILSCVTSLARVWVRNDFSWEKYTVRGTIQSLSEMFDLRRAT